MFSWPLEPDFGRVLTAVRRGEPDRVPFAELYHDHEIMEAVLGEPIPRHCPTLEDRRHYYRKRIQVWYQLGYDFVTIPVGPDLPSRKVEAPDTARLSRGMRSWVDESRGAIETREDFARYPWPDPEAVDCSAVEIAEEFLPEGMKIVVTTSGVLENVMWLMGYAPMCYAIADDPELICEMFQFVGERVLKAHETVAPADSVGATWLGDDMGFRHATMISPRLLKEHVFPWQKRMADAAHAQGKPFFLHACGNLEEIMDDLIDRVGIDAKHAFEDAIIPVPQAKRLYGSRVALMGGVDMHFICSASEDEVRAYVRRVLEECAPGGGYILGTGNSVANYVPLRNYLGMLDEGRKFCQ